MAWLFWQDFVGYATEKQRRYREIDTLENESDDDKIEESIVFDKFVIVFIFIDFFNPSTLENKHKKEYYLSSILSCPGVQSHANALRVY